MASSCDASYGFLPCSTTPGGALFLVGAYGWLLLKGANLISDGGEALLDAGLAPSLVGGLVLPVMGALPDTLIVLASGFHGAAARGRHPRRALREQVDVGVGALVGSTVMLLTVVYGGSIVVGRCERDKRTGRALDRQPPALDESWMPRWLRENGAQEEEEQQPQEQQQEEERDVERGERSGLTQALLPASSGGHRHPLARRLASLCRRSIRTLIAKPLLLLFAGAVSTDARTPAAARVMAASTLLWLFAELPVLLTSWSSSSPSTAAATIAAASSWASLLGTVLCFLALALYCLSHVLLPHSDEAEAAAAAAERGAARHYYLAAHRHALRVRAVRSFAWAAGHRHGGLVDAQGRVRPEATLALFRRFDRDNSGAIDRAELRALIMGLEIARPGLAGSSADAPPRLLPVVVGGGAQGAAADKKGADAHAAAAAKALGHPLLSDAELDAHVRAWMREFDRDRSGGIDYGEFHNGIERWVAYKRRAYAARRRQQEDKAQQQEKEAVAAVKEQQTQQQAPGVVAVVVVPSGQEDEAAAAAAAPGSPASSGRGGSDEASGSGCGTGDEQPPSQEQQQQPPKKKKTEAEKAARREAKLRAVDPVGAETAALAALDGDDADPAGMAIPSLRRASSSGAGGGGGAAAGSAAALTTSSPSAAAAAAALTAALLRQQCGEEEVGEDGVALCFVDDDEDDDEEEEERQQQRRHQRQAANANEGAAALELLSPTSLSRGSSGADHRLPLSSSPSAADANAPLALTTSSASGGDSSSSDSGSASAGPRSLWATLALSAAWFAAGTLLCAAFAGPLVNSLGDLATATRIPSFTLSFFLAPLASNASELVSSLRFAAGRRASRISATFSQVYGAVVMNHTMVLGALLAVVHYRNLALANYAGQAVLMVLPTLAVGWLGATRTTFKAWLGPLLLAVYPLALGLQYALLEAGGQAAGP